MTADYESWLKKAWGWIACDRNFDCRTYDTECDYCEGHAALLGMVDVHCEEAACNRHSIDPMESHQLRRRLRAAVGVND